MDLYLVRNHRGHAVWVAWEDDEMRIWSHVQNTGMFHMNQGLYLDFYFDHHNTYEPIEAAAAREAIRDGVGRFDEDIVGHLVKKYREDPDARSLEDVLDGD